MQLPVGSLTFIVKVFPHVQSSGTALAQVFRIPLKRTFLLEIKLRYMPFVWSHSDRFPWRELNCSPYLHNNFRSFLINKPFFQIKHPCEKFNTLWRESLTGTVEGSRKHYVGRRLPCVSWVWSAWKGPKRCRWSAKLMQKVPIDGIYQDFLYLLAPPF